MDSIPVYHLVPLFYALVATHSHPRVEVLLNGPVRVRPNKFPALEIQGANNNFGIFIILLVEVSNEKGGHTFCQIFFLYKPFNFVI
jgi:hypothetical protein